MADLTAHGGCYCLGQGTYIQTSEFKIFYASDFIIDGCNGTLKYRDGAEVEWGYSGLHLVNCSNFEIRNLIIDGNRANRTEAEVPAHSLFMRGCRNFKLENVRSTGAVVDGFYLREKDGDYCENDMISNCSAIDAYRNGCSVINGRNIVFTGGFYDNSGSVVNGVEGTLPRTGIDVEENIDQPNGPENIKFKGVTFRNNAGYGIMLTHHGNASSAKVDGCYFENNRRGAIIVKQTDVLITGCTFKHFDTADNGIVDVRGHIRSQGIRVVNNYFQDISAAFPCIAIQGDIDDGSPSNVVVSGNIVRNASKAIVTCIDGIIIINNILENVLNESAVAINVKGSNGIIQGNQIKRATKCAVFVDGAHCKILNNIIIDTTVTSNDYGAIRTITGLNDIIGNTIKLSPANRSATAISIVNGANFVKHNVIEGYTLESTWQAAKYPTENVLSETI
jgi:hypothetical protein